MPYCNIREYHPDIPLFGFEASAREVDIPNREIFDLVKMGGKNQQILSK